MGTKGHPEALEGLEEGDSLPFWKDKAHQNGIRISLNSQIHELRTKSK